MSWAKGLNMDPDVVLWEKSYESLIMYGAATPQWDDEKEEAWDMSKDASEPGNFELNGEEEEVIR